MCLHMSAKTRNEYIQLKKKRYRLLSGKKPKSQILNEAQATTGYSRKHLIRKFSSLRRIYTNSQPGRPKKLSGDVILIVKEIWLQSEQPCGMRLKSILKEKVASFLSSMYPRTGTKDSQLQRSHSGSDPSSFQSSVL